MAEPSQPRIVDFLRDLARDDEKLHEYGRNRGAVLARSNLTAEQRAVLESDDLVRIRDAIRQESGIPEHDFFMLVVFFQGPWRRFERWLQKLLGRRERAAR